MRRATLTARPASTATWPARSNSGEGIAAWENRAGGASHTSTLMDHPGLAGPTFVGKKLGINGIKDVK
jgi:hypothetical protein